MKTLKSYKDFLFENWSDFGGGDYALYDNEAGGQFWGNLAGGVLPICSETKRILLNKRSRYVNEPHTYGTWGGKVDRGDEDIEDTVMREFLEECGYMGEIEMIPAFVFKTEGFEYHNFIGVVENEFEPELDWESEGYKWVTIEELFEMPDKHPGLKMLLEDPESIENIKEIL